MTPATRFPRPPRGRSGTRRPSILRTALPSLAVAAATLSFPVCAAESISDNYAIQSDVFNAGVAPMTSANYRLSSSLGDPFFTGSTSSASYRAGFGLWPAGTSAVAPLGLTGALSRKVHGSAGTFDLALSTVGTNPTTEPRSGGADGNHSIVFTFDQPVTSGSAAVTAGTATAGTPTFSGNQMTVPITGVSNQQYVTVAVSDVVGDGGSGSGSVRVGFLLGDVNQNRVVTVSDLAQVNAQIAQVVTASNYLRDVNANGTLTVADKGIANTQITKALPAP